MSNRATGHDARAVRANTAARVSPLNGRAIGRPVAAIGTTFFSLAVLLFVLSFTTLAQQRAPSPGTTPPTSTASPGTLPSTTPPGATQPSATPGGTTGANARAATSPANAATSRVDDRIRALQSEAGRLAGESRTLIGEVRKLEIARDLRTEEARHAQAAADQARTQFEQTTERLQALEVQRLAGLPELKAQLVQVYKRGQRGYLRLLLSASGLRDFARVSRAVSSLAYREERLVRDHRQTLDQLRAERDQLAGEMRTLRTRTEAARAASALAEQAVEARAALIAQIDSRRDLTAQYVGELQQVRAKLEEQLRADGPAAMQAASPVPLGPFRGGLDWPVAGTLTGRFGQPSPTAASLVRDGIEISAPAGTTVRAVHAGTVSYADPFTGLGTLVIVDHGDDNHSLYGYLGDLAVQRGQRVEAGGPIGRVGASPAGPPALYFEMRIDGRLADPVQWLKPR